MLEHLVIVPQGGLCNRLRALASARRLAEMAGARCTVAWQWGEYPAQFDDDTDWWPYRPARDQNPDEFLPGYHHIRHVGHDRGGNARNRRLSLTAHPRVVVYSNYVFGALGEAQLVGQESQVFAWFPRLHPAIRAKVDAFRQAHFPERIVGLHMRRADNRPAQLRSPDRAYWKEANRLVRQRYRLFLATDHAATLRAMQQRYGSALLHNPKGAPWEKRWPRSESTNEDVADDLIDLYLLGACNFVVGSSWSSYSRVAILLNGSPRCKVIDWQAPRVRYGLESLWRRARRKWRDWSARARG